MSVASEMVDEMSLSHGDANKIAHAIKEEIVSLTKQSLQSNAGSMDSASQDGSTELQEGHHEISSFDNAQSLSRQESSGMRFEGAHCSREPSQLFSKQNSAFSKVGSAALAEAQQMEAQSAAHPDLSDTRYDGTEPSQSMQEQEAAAVGEDVTSHNVASNIGPEVQKVRHCLTSLGPMQNMTNDLFSVFSTTNRADRPHLGEFLQQTHQGSFSKVEETVTCKFFSSTSSFKKVMSLKSLKQAARLNWPLMTTFLPSLKFCRTLETPIVVTDLCDHDSSLLFCTCLGERALWECVSEHFYCRQPSNVSIAWVDLISWITRNSLAQTNEIVSWEYSCVS